MSYARAMGRWASAQRIPLLLFAVTFFAYAYFAQASDWACGARFAQVRALTESQTFAINDYARYAAFKFPGGLRTQRIPPGPLTQEQLADSRLLTLDVSVYDGRLYPNKPPGTSLAAVPGYALGLLWTRLRGESPDDYWPLVRGAYVARVFSAGLAGALAVALAFLVVRRLTPDRPMIYAVLGACTLGFATPLLPISTTLHDHSLTTCALFAAFALLLRDGDRPSRLTQVGAGLCCGAAVVFHYLAALGVIALLIYAACLPGSRRERAQRLGWICLGGLPHLVFLLAYHQVCFGSPFATANTYQFAAQGDERLLLGMFGVPRLEALVGITFSPYRGLFYSAPILLLAPVGATTLWRAGRKREVAFLLLLPLTILLVISGFFGWHSGPFFMSRYLVPTLPYLAVLVAYAADQRKIAIGAGLLFLASASAMLLATAVQPLAPGEYADPFLDFLLPVLRGEAVPYGWPPAGPISAGIYAPSGHAFTQFPELAVWASFNLGEFLFLNSLWSLLPYLLVVGGGVGLAVRWALDEGGPEAGEAAPS